MKTAPRSGLFIRSTLFVALSVCATPFLPAQAVEYLWTSGRSGAWEVNANWTPAPDAGVIGFSKEAFADKVVIDGAVTVRRRGNLAFKGTADGKGGTIDAITLKGGASLSVAGDLQVTSASAQPNSVKRNVFIGEGSRLSVGRTLTVGTQNSSGNNNEWIIRGSVTAKALMGMQSSTQSRDGKLNGGYVLNIEGGKLTIAEEFDWRVLAKENVRTDLTGILNISKGGEVSIGVMGKEWDFSSEQYVNFADGTGSLTFGKPNWESEDAVLALIKSGHIRKEGPVRGRITLRDNGDTWTLSIVKP